MFNLQQFKASCQELLFVCIRCRTAASEKVAAVGCSICNNKIFRVAKSTTLMNQPIQNPYRSRETPEDGEKLNTPGTMGEMGESGLGSTDSFYQDDGSYHDSDPFDRNLDGGSSDKFMEDTPLDPANGHPASPVGAYNLQGSVDANTQGDLFERLRSMRRKRL